MACHTAVVMTSDGTSAPRQRVYNSHTDDITCMALHPTLPLIATVSVPFHYNQL
jgi:hypothetical protein